MKEYAQILENAKKQFTGVDKNGSAMVKYDHFRK